MTNPIKIKMTFHKATKNKNVYKSNEPDPVAETIYLDKKTLMNVEEIEITIRSTAEKGDE